MFGMADEYVMWQIYLARLREVERNRLTRQPRAAKKRPLRLLVRARCRPADWLFGERIGRITLSERRNKPRQVQWMGPGLIL